MSDHRVESSTIGLAEIAYGKAQTAIKSEDIQDTVFNPSLKQAHGGYESSTQFRAKLVVIESAGGGNSSTGFTENRNYESNSIYFPAMPEIVELARSANYDQISTRLTPDGVPIYNNTQPLEIPIEFSLSSFDTEYCTLGAMTLMVIAARLHALVMPNFSDNIFADINLGGNTQSIKTTADTASKSSLDMKSPPRCWLDLTGNTAWPGVSCYGYVKSVSAQLKGPWLSSSTVNNLPSSATYKFVFVNSPGYSSNIGSGIRQTPASRVQRYLYSNTVSAYVASSSIVNMTNSNSRTK